jgi:serine/threonine-protein kinase
MKAQVQELFHAVADLSAETRQRYFEERNIDSSMQREVEALVEFDSQATISLLKDISQVAEETVAGMDTAVKQCGPYKVGTLLGRGGMGTVRLAERVDGESTQQVAVKLLRPGSDDPQNRRRFLAERQILATLSHPNIARLLDAGHGDDGQPYLVMEFIDGKPIDVFACGLDLRDKIVLFLKVCGAVAYLHRNLVVHRDLKPANILVTPDGEPKLLDFGIAKMLDMSLDSAITHMRMLTPDYASPEQVSGRPMTTATDIYSLGAVLYKLLTGESPHQFETASIKSIITAVCSGRIVPPSRHVPALKGDLEMILMKALRTDPQERYAAIEHFAYDLVSYLESRRAEPWRHWKNQLPGNAFARSELIAARNP